MTSQISWNAGVSAPQGSEKGNQRAVDNSGNQSGTGERQMCRNQKLDVSESVTDPQV